MRKSRRAATVCTLGILTAIGAAAMDPSGARAQEAYAAEIKFFAFTTCPPGWAEANGQLLPVTDNQALFDVIGTTFGGDGTTSFAVPNLAGEVSTTETPPPPTTTAQRSRKGEIAQQQIPPATVPQQTHKARRVKLHGAEEEAPTTPEDGTGTPILACIALEGFPPSTPALVPTETLPSGGELPPDGELPADDVPPDDGLPPEDELPADDELPEEGSETG